MQSQAYVPRPRPPQKQRAPGVRSTELKVHARPFTKCAAKYFSAIHNPFSELAVGACVPTEVALPSYKLTTRTRFTFNTGTTGSGGVTFYPYRMLFKEAETVAVTIDEFKGYPVLATSALYSPAGSDPFHFTNAQAPNIADPQFTQNIVTTSPLATSYFAVGTARTARLVGGGIKVTSVGKYIDMSGEYIVWNNPDTSSTVNGDHNFLADFLQQQQTNWCRITADTYAEAVYYPLLQEDLQYRREPATQSPIAYDNGIINRLAAAILINGTEPGTPFIVEAVAHFEIQGSAANLTPSHSDPQAVGAVLSAIPSTPQSTVNATTEEVRVPQNMARLIKMGVEEGIKYVPVVSEAYELFKLANKTYNMFEEATKTGKVVW